MRTTRSTILVLALAAPLAFGASRATAADGAELYQKNCASCHGADGKADSAAAKAMKVKPLAGIALSPEDVVKFVKSNDRHKAVRGKLSDDDLMAIAKALPGR
jgi:mono/diheme cytochrome c family protein